jgi:hypothetical protein
MKRSKYINAFLFKCNRGLIRLCPQPIPRRSPLACTRSIILQAPKPAEDSLLSSIPPEPRSGQNPTLTHLHAARRSNGSSHESRCLSPHRTPPARIRRSGIFPLQIPRSRHRCRVSLPSMSGSGYEDLRISVYKRAVRPRPRPSLQRSINS